MMYDLDHEISLWVGKLREKKSLLHRDIIREIEGHLRDEIEDLLESGLTPEQAFKRSVKAFGSPSDLMNEYNKAFCIGRLTQGRNVLSHYFDGRTIMRIFFGLMIGVALLLIGYGIQGGHLVTLIQLTSFIMVTGIAAGSLVMVYPFSILRRSFVIVVTGREASRKALSDASRVCRTFGDIAFLAGFVCIPLGAIQILTHLEHLNEIGPGCAVVVTGSLYGFLAKLFVGKAMADSLAFRAETDDSELKKKPECVKDEIAA